MTAPHGPSEKVLDGFLHRWKNLVGECEYTAATGNPALNRAAREALWALGAEIVAEVRAAVVAEVLAIVEGEAAKQRRLASDAAASKGLGVMHFVAGTEADAIATAIRALLPPVSAPGPTLPRTPSGWDGPTMREFVRGREWSCVQAETGDVITLDDRGLVTLYGFDGTPLSDLQALLAALASRAERGPDAGGEG